MDACQSRLDMLYGHTKLSQFSGKVQDAWDDMSGDEKRSIILSILKYIDVGPVVKFGSNKFDPDRLTFVWRKALEVENAHVAIVGLQARMTHSKMMWDSKHPAENVAYGESW